MAALNLVNHNVIIHLMKILVTGGAGYIGSHTIVELLNNNHEVIIIDNLSNSSRESINRIEDITQKKVEFYEADVRDIDALNQIFEKNKIDAVIHFAGLKSVGESISVPLAYYQNNIDSTLALLNAMSKHNVKKLVFSSSAVIYGNPEFLPVKEDSPVGKASNRYGWTKIMIEQILRDVVTAKGDWNITSLRYFNPIGAHESGTIGEDPNDIPNNLFPNITQVATGKLSELNIFGNDYDTRDGTCLRDYIHVVDLAKAHLAALEHLNHPDVYKAYNIGTGRDTSVLELIEAFEKVTGVKVPFKFAHADRGI